MPFQHLHDDIERRTSSRAPEPCSVFDGRLPVKEKQQKLRCLEFLLQRYALLPRQSIVHKCTINSASPPTPPP